MRKTISLSKNKELSQDQVLENADVADGGPDSTSWAQRRPDGWNPQLVTSDDYDRENPYSRRPGSRFGR